MPWDVPGAVPVEVDGRHERTRHGYKNFTTILLMEDS
jgi:hypothetical protein